MMDQIFHTSALPAEIDAIIHKATNENPLERYETVQILIEDLQRYLTNYPVSAKEYKPAEVFEKNNKNVL